MGLVGVGLANVLAGQASKHTRKMVVMKSHPLQPGFWEAPNPEDLVLDAIMGACIFKVRVSLPAVRKGPIQAVPKSGTGGYRTHSKPTFDAMQLLQQYHSVARSLSTGVVACALSLALLHHRPCPHASLERHRLLFAAYACRHWAVASAV